MATTSDNLMIPLEPLEQDKKDELKEHLTQRRFSVTDQDISLHSLVELREKWCLNLFLDFIENKENKHEYLEAPDSDGRTPLLTAVRCKQPEALKKLLDAGANINARDERGYGVLHHLVLKFSDDNPQTEEQQQQQEEEQEPLLKMLELLLSSRYVEILELEPHGGLYRETPLEFAASRLKKGYEPLGLYKLEDMLKKAVKQKKENHSLKSKMAKVVDLIIRDSSGDEVRKVLVDMKNNELWKIANQKIGRYSLLFYAVHASNSSVVKVLLESGADPWKEESWARELPLHRAAAKGNVEIFTILLEKMIDLKGNKSLEKYSYSLIKKLLENGNMKGKDMDHMKCFHLLLKKGVIQDVNQISSGKTPLCLAAEYNNEEMILGLLEAGAFIGARKDSEKDDRTIWDILPQGILPRAMDRLITQEKNKQEEKKKKEEGKKLIRQETGNENEEEVVKRKDYTLRLDYCFLLPPHQESDSNEPMKEMKTLMDMHDSGKHRDAIKHPLVKTLLQAKWSKAKRFHKIDLAFCFLFVGLLSVFAYLLKDLQERMHITMYILKGLLGFLS
ncbi:serine/threonine-protein phosphatase 6 regulatory ankyrin repeat subunit C-like isoform X1 [Portunus trituberculatus]|uniref:serine/threonine-protein phosphatase 6 regulatory ankyrin repeat subunit C-like isoform X1 n=1 Tax=Portunus trituberculatus TaxID=210409 RepID=UPI001E1CFBDF|nr:serine/threonine-protein phosphatase 6 regulatory ankyrin repeat subunit C-like isoform X1 [Portunus trituberculatus]